VFAVALARANGERRSNENKRRGAEDEPGIPHETVLRNEQPNFFSFCMQCEGNLCGPALLPKSCVRSVDVQGMAYRDTVASAEEIMRNVVLVFLGFLLF